MCSHSSLTVQSYIVEQIPVSQKIARLDFQKHEYIPGGDSHMKQTGMLVVSLRGVNFGFWSRLGCPAQSANILRR